MHNLSCIDFENSYRWGFNYPMEAGLYFNAQQAMQGLSSVFLWTSVGEFCG